MRFCKTITCGKLVAQLVGSIRTIIDGSWHDKYEWSCGQFCLVAKPTSESTNMKTVVKIRCVRRSGSVIHHAKYTIILIDKNIHHIPIATRLPRRHVWCRKTLSILYTFQCITYYSRFNVWTLLVHYCTFCLYNRVDYKKHVKVYNQQRLKMCGIIHKAMLYNYRN